MAEVLKGRQAVRRRAATRERLLDAARIVLARDGIQGASVEHICEEAGFTRGAFYSNFTTKDDLVLALFNREHERMLELLHTAADPASFMGTDPLEIVRLIVDRFLVLNPPEREWYLLHTEFQLRVVRDDAIGREFVAVLRQVRTDLESFMYSVLDALNLRLTVDVGHAATVLMGTYEMAIREAFVEDREIDQSLLQQTLPILLYSLTEPNS